MKLEFIRKELDYLIQECMFTDREEKVLEMRCRGKSIIQISMELYISPRTVDNCIKKIKQKIHKVL